MNVTIRDHWEDFIKSAIKTGQFSSAEDVVLAGLRLVEERDKKRAALRATINASIEAGGSYTDDEVAAYLHGRAKDTLSQPR